MGVLINRALSLLLLRVDTGVHQHMLVLPVRRPLPACISIRTALCYVGARRPSSSTGVHQHTHGSMLCWCSPSVVLYRRATAYARLYAMSVLAVRRPLPACISIRTALCYVGARRPRLDASNAEDSCTTDSSLHVPCVRASCPSLHTHRSGGASAIKRCFTILSSQDRTISLGRIL
jgi:hypothetical protein